MEILREFILLFWQSITSPLQFQQNVSLLVIVLFDMGKVWDSSSVHVIRQLAFSIFVMTNL